MKNPESIFKNDQIKWAIKESFLKLDPRTMYRNPVMFTVEICTAVMLVEIARILFSTHYSPLTTYNIVVFLVLLVTLLFANFAESIAEARGKAQAESLRKTREDTPAKLVSSELVSGEKSVVSKTSTHSSLLTSHPAHHSPLTKQSVLQH